MYKELYNYSCNSYDKPLSVIDITIYTLKTIPPLLHKYIQSYITSFRIKWLKNYWRFTILIKSWKYVVMFFLSETLFRMRPCKQKATKISHRVFTANLFSNSGICYFLKVTSPTNDHEETGHWTCLSYTLSHCNMMLNGYFILWSTKNKICLIRKLLSLIHTDGNN